MTDLPPTRRERIWPLWGAVAGAFGFVATVLMDVRPQSELDAVERGEPFAVTSAVMDELARMPNYLGFLFGYVAVLALIVFASAWRTRVDPRFPDSIASRVVSGGALVTAAGLALAYGWKGALANYGYEGPEFGMFGDEGLFVYFMLTDFGPYLPWLGVVASAAALAWLAWIDGAVSRILGTFSGCYAALVLGAFVVSGVPGISGPLTGIWLLIASVWLAVGRSRATLPIPPSTAAPVVAQS